MNYNPIPDLIIMGGLISVLVALIKLTTKKPRGATPEPDRAALEMHQKIRRLENVTRV